MPAGMAIAGFPVADRYLTVIQSELSATVGHGSDTF